MEWLNRLFCSDIRIHKNVVLLVKVRRDDETTDERRLVVEERQIDQICDEAVNEADAKEVWVYRKIYHHTRLEPDEDDPFIMGLTMGAGQMLRNK